MKEAEQINPKEIPPLLTDREMEKLRTLLEQFHAARENEEFEASKEIDEQIKALTTGKSVVGYRVTCLTKDGDIQEQVGHRRHATLTKEAAEEFWDILPSEPQSYSPWGYIMTLYGQALVEVKLTECIADKFFNGSVYGPVVELVAVHKKEKAKEKAKEEAEKSESEPSTLRRILNKIF